MSSILPDDVPIIPKPTNEYLNERQLVDYREHRENFLEWLFTLGKRPEYGESYLHAVKKTTAYRTDLFYRAVWDENGYTTIITQAQLRHKSEQTTMRYDQTPVEDRRDALDRMR